MNCLLHELLNHKQGQAAVKTALTDNVKSVSYQQLSQSVLLFAKGLLGLGVDKQDRIAIYLPDSIETAISIFGTSTAGCVFVPINQKLKSHQAAFILSDCQASVLVTTAQRYEQIKAQLTQSIKAIIIVGEEPCTLLNEVMTIVMWPILLRLGGDKKLPVMDDSQLAALFYTSGSTGQPKGVMLTHRNLVKGAESVASYLELYETDRVLVALPLSFDYGFSQLTTAFARGASCFIINYLFPMDILQYVEDYQITGLALVPPVWNKLAAIETQGKQLSSIRYFCNSGGAMSQSTLFTLKSMMPQAQTFLMYGLTEAFRSCYLPPSKVDQKPLSFGRAIPNATILVVNDDGDLCKPYEHGELVHLGPLVSQGYWQREHETAQKFKILSPNLAKQYGVFKALFSGDIVYTDEDGDHYFVRRKDDLIKSSGYRISPNEVEQIILSSGLTEQAVVFGVQDSELGQAIILVVQLKEHASLPLLRTFCCQQLPSFQMPKFISTDIPMILNANGKIDRIAIRLMYLAQQESEKGEVVCIN